MANVVVKTIWQSKEIHEVGDEAGDPPPPSWSPRLLGGVGVPSPVKGIAKKKKALSFHG